MSICLYCACQYRNALDKSREVLGPSWARPFKRGLARGLRSLSDLPKSKTFSFNFVFNYVKENIYLPNFDWFFRLLVRFLLRKKKSKYKKFYEKAIDNLIIPLKNQKFPENEIRKMQSIKVKTVTVELQQDLENINTDLSP